MNYFFLKIFHLSSIVVLFLSFGMILVNFSARTRKIAYALHGVSWLCVLVSAVGLVNILGMHANFPLWANIKFYIWIALIPLLLVMRKKPQWVSVTGTLLVTLAIVAIWLAVAKPSFS
ncbi:hypothetical protein [Bdellovibrio bacteriovorus]|uniref:hypothetical protein n=1 Tax=Bdellovibrio TaxID=958 RepID=UPI0035A996AB